MKESSEMVFGNRHLPLKSRSRSLLFYCPIPVLVLKLKITLIKLRDSRWVGWGRGRRIARSRPV